MKILETVNLDNNSSFSVWHSDHIALRSVLSLILKNYAGQLNNKFVVPTNVWAKFDDAKVVWAQDQLGQILGGICFYIDHEFNMGNIMIVFKNGTEYRKDIHATCMKHFRSIAKSAGMTVIVQHTHVENHEDIELAKYSNLSPTFYFLSQSLVDNDQE
jgi:hypothetical protein